MKEKKEFTPENSTIVSTDLGHNIVVEDRVLLKDLYNAQSSGANSTRERTEYIFESRFISAYDGDSLTLLDDLGHNVTVKSKVRLKGLDTPELRGGTPLTKQAAKIVRDYVILWCEGEELINSSLKDDKDKYGRYLIELYKEGILLNHHLIEIGFARPYFGEKKTPWTDREATQIINSSFAKILQPKQN